MHGSSHHTHRVDLSLHSSPIHTSHTMKPRPQTNPPQGKHLHSNHRSDYVTGISSVRWRRLRQHVLSRHPMCQRCEAEGRITPATEVHHVRPVEDAPTAAERARLMFDVHNLRSLCHACHVLTHIEMGRGGVKGNRRRVDEENGKLARYFNDSEE